MVARNAAVPASSNILLKQLSAKDREILMPHVDELTVGARSVLVQANAPLDVVYFPTAVTVSLEEPLPGGGGVEIAVTGKEGMVGWSALLGAGSSPHAALVHGQGGTLLRVGVKPLRAACQCSPTLHAILLQFVHVMMIQMARAIASHLGHALDRRVARWLLMRHDRLGGDVLRCQHDEIARALSVRRASITNQLHLIEGERLIRCTRGRVAVRDRCGLERYAGDAYGHAEEHYRRLIGPFGKSGTHPVPERAVYGAANTFSYDNYSFASRRLIKRVGRESEAEYSADHQVRT